MRILFLIGFLYSSLVRAELPELPLAGTYFYGGAVTVTFKMRYETVHADSAEGRAQLKKRIESGDSCDRRPRTTFLCTGLESIGGAAEEVQSRVDVRLGGSSLAIEE